MIEFNSASKQKPADLIPDGTVVPVHLNLRPGNAGDGGWLKRSKAGNSLMLDCEFVVIEGPYAKRKFWTLFTVDGETDGHAKASDISRARLRSMLESARGVNPDDESDAAQRAREVEGWGDFDGMRFWAKVGIEKGKDGYADKNILREVITPDRKAWSKLDGSTSAAPAAPRAAPAPANSGRPSWAA